MGLLFSVPRHVTSGRYINRPESIFHMRILLSSKSPATASSARPLVIKTSSQRLPRDCSGHPLARACLPANWGGSSLAGDVRWAVLAKHASCMQRARLVPSPTIELRFPQFSDLIFFTCIYFARLKSSRSACRVHYDMSHRPLN